MTYKDKLYDCIDYCICMSYHSSLEVIAEMVRLKMNG